ncbi:PilZ domain-containing protein [Chthonobacter albigriseus]|uniref:PilZ domain-containing protein n=1 Tax=Chthonobacter albigriseus TaxID=1683161 RepID=UPI0015EF99FD|nr:PilZ domain-containing protein [Chthonobacter albigriseus]
MAERRKYPRRRSYLAGRVVFANRYCSIDCLVRDISRAGARLVLPRVRFLPLEFELILTDRKRTVRAKRIWSDPNDVGVRFEEEGDYLSPLSEAEERIRRLAQENGRLKARIDQLTP